MGKAHAAARAQRRAQLSRIRSVNSSSFRLSPTEEAQLAAWLGDLRGKRMSVAEAARRLGCSRGVVSRARDSVRGKALRGRPPVLCAVEEEAIKTKILHYHARGVPLTETDVCSAVQQYVNNDVNQQRRGLLRQAFEDGRPGRD